MRLLSLNVGFPENVRARGRMIHTGIFKRPVSGAVMARERGLDGDGQADLRYHGGPYRALYAYASQDCEHWATELNRPLDRGGQFGENLTIDGATSDTIRLGDVLRVGEALTQVTQPRPPCFKLGIRMGLPAFPKRFLGSGRVGFYLRVLREGAIREGDTVEIVERHPAGLTVAGVSRLRYFDKGDVEAAERALMIQCMSPGWLREFRERVEGANGGHR
ncbi:MAG: MOSC domain-containing protein [SAR202 cluster bacterium]|nr:MOSC domain-containing protein [SAR202 cluster bacterium]